MYGNFYLLGNNNYSKEYLMKLNNKMIKITFEDRFIDYCGNNLVYYSVDIEKSSKNYKNMLNFIKYNYKNKNYKFYLLSSKINKEIIKYFELITLQTITDDNILKSYISKKNNYYELENMALNKYNILLPLIYENYNKLNVINNLSLGDTYDKYIYTENLWCLNDVKKFLCIIEPIYDFDDKNNFKNSLLNNKNNIVNKNKNRIENMYNSLYLDMK